MGYRLAVLLFIVCTVFADVTIEFKNDVLLKGPDILLSDISTIKSDDPSVKNELAGLRIGRTALPGYNVNIPTNRIRISTLKPFYDRGLDIVVYGAKNVIVKTDSKTLYGVSLTEQIQKCLFEKLPWPKSKVQITITAVPEVLVIPNEKYSLSIEPASDCDFRGNEPMQVVISDSVREIKRFPIIIRIKIFETVCIADKKLKRKTVLSDADLKLDTRDVTEIHENFYSNIAEIEGKSLDRTILAGTVLTEDMIEVPFLVKRGDKVKIVSREKTAMVTADGIAKKDGRMGDKIQVRNSINNKLVDVWVCGTGEVNLCKEYGGLL